MQYLRFIHMGQLLRRPGRECSGNATRVVEVVYRQISIFTITHPLAFIDKRLLYQR